MEISKSQQRILDRLKRRGAQSVKILSNQLGMTTMGVRQHLQDLAAKGIISQTKEEKQTRGRPIRLWELTKIGHSRYPNTHEQIAVDLLNAIELIHGETAVQQVITHQSQQTLERYQRESGSGEQNLSDRIAKLSKLRTEDGFMAEVRLLPDGWLLIENHCPVCSAAQNCPALCSSELKLFSDVLGNSASVERLEHLMSGNRRCAYKITQAAMNEMR